MNKIAVFHSFMDNIGGAEMVTLTIARELDADVYTTNIDPKKIQKMGFGDVLPRIKSIGQVPKKAPFRHQIVLWKFRRLNLRSDYDFFIISGDWAMSAAVNNYPNLWYVHSPLNEIWQWSDYVRENLLSFWQKPIFNLWVKLNRFLTRKYAKKVNKWVCNSKNTQQRIKKYYKQDAEIINPPIYTKKYSNLGRGDYWLSVNRLLKHKRVELQVEAFKKMPKEKLILVGSYEKGASQFEEYKNYIEKIKPENVEILNWVSEKDLIKLYGSCKGFITTSRDEDFGMNVVEAMSAGKPVIAPNEGGYKESIINNKNGILIDNIDSEKIVEAVKKINLDCNIGKNSIDRAAEFDTNVFMNKLNKIINDKK